MSTSIGNPSREVLAGHERATSSSFHSPLVIWLIAFTARALYVLVQTKTAFASGSFYATDSRLYDALAQSIVNGGGLSYAGQPTAYVTPGYPVFLALCYWLVGRNFLLIGLLQSALGAAVAVFVYRMAREIFDREVAWVAGLLCALMPELIVWGSGQILTEPLYIFLLTAALYALISLVPSDEKHLPAAHAGSSRFLLAATAGVLLGLSALTRPVALIFGACCILYLWRKAGFLRASIVALGLLLMIAPWVYRNHSRLGTAMMTTETGWVLYLYHSPQTEASNGGYDPHVARVAEARGLSEVEQNRFYLRAALAYAFANPARELVLSVNRFWNMWRPTYAVASLRHRAVATLTYLPLICFAIPAVLVLRFRHPRISVLTLFLLFHFVFHLFVASELRFRVPLMPVLAIYAAFGMIYTYRSFFPAHESVLPSAKRRDLLSVNTDAASSVEREGLRVSVVVPVFNEATRIESMLHQIRAVPLASEVIVVNDGSTDGTAEKLDGLAQFYDRRCELRENSGKGAAVLTGVRAATGDVIVFQDADGELSPEDYPALLAPFLDEGTMVVYGSRFLKAGTGVDRPPVPWLNRWANRVLTGATNFLFGSRLTDMETGFKMCRSEVIKSLELKARRYEFEPEVTALLLTQGFPIREVPVSYYPRPQSEKSIGLRDGWLALWVLLRIRLIKR
jgi:4-amino-4-deoxy-L-arabinose transferase-like glycosyltransferase